MCKNKTAKVFAIILASLLMIQAQGFMTIGLYGMQEMIEMQREDDAHVSSEEHNEGGEVRTDAAITDKENGLNEADDLQRTEFADLNDTAKNVTPLIGDLPDIEQLPPKSEVNLTDFFEVVIGENKLGTDTKVSQVYPNTISVVGNTNDQVGAIWAKEKIDLTRTASARSKIYLQLPQTQNPYRSAGDGMTLTFHNDPAGTKALGGAGQGIGVYKQDTSKDGGKTGTYIKNGLTFELDTFPNSQASPVSGYDLGFVGRLGAGSDRFHAAFAYTGEMSTPPTATHYQKTHKQALSFDRISGLRYGAWIDFDYEWTPTSLTDQGLGNLKVKLANQTFELRDVNIDETFGTTREDRTVYWGYTAATGGNTMIGAVAVEDLAQQANLQTTVTVFDKTLFDDETTSYEEKLELPSTDKLVPGQQLSYKVTIKETVGERAFDGSTTIKISEGLKNFHNLRVRKSNGVISQVDDKDISINDKTITIQNMDSLLSDTYDFLFDVEVETDYADTVASVSASSKSKNELVKYDGAKSERQIANAADLILNLNDIAVTLVEAQHVTLEDVLSRALPTGSVAQINSQALEAAAVQFSVMQTELAKLHNLTEVSQTPISLTLGGTYLGLYNDKTIDVYVYDAIGSDEKTETIQGVRAKGFTVELDQFQTLDADGYERFFIESAQAQVYDIKRLPPREVARSMSIDSERLTSVGRYDVTFVSPNGQAQVVVQVHVIDTRELVLQALPYVRYEKMDSRRIDEQQLLSDAQFTANKQLTTVKLDQFADIDFRNVGAQRVEVTASAAIDETTEATKRLVLIVLVTDEHTLFDEANNTMVSAYDFDLNLSEVQAADFVASAKATAWNIIDATAVPVRLITEKPATGGVHNVTFIADKSEKTVIANITDDVDPELVVDGRIVYEAGSSKDEAGFLADIHATLNEAGTITSNFKDVVDLNKVGAYVVRVQGDDTAGNKSNTVQTIVLVKDANTVIDEATNVMMRAYDFALNLTEVPAADFVVQAEAQAWNIVDGQPVAVKLESAKPTTGGAHDTVFSAGKTTKTVKANITDDIDPELSADTRIIYDAGTVKDEAGFLTDIHARLNEAGTIISNFETVVDMHTVGAYVVELNATDTAGNKSNTIQIIVLVRDENTFIDEANNTMMTAYDFVLNLSEVPAADFVVRAKATAWSIIDATLVPVTLKTAKPTTGGIADVTFIADKSEQTVKATITDDIDPVLNADARVTYDVSTTKTAEDFLVDVHATLDEAGTITSNFADVVDMSKVGAYVVTLDATDTVGNKSNTVTTMVLVKDEHIVIDEVNNTMISAYDFSLNLSDVPMADFVAEAKAEAWNIADGTVVELTLITEKPTIGGSHDTVFSAGKTTKMVKANITDDIDPELTAAERVIYDAGVTKDEAAFLADIHATLNEAGTITSNFTDVVDMQKIGVYVVELHGTDTAGNKSNTVQTIVLVKDESTFFDEANNTMMSAYDFALNLSEVPTANFVAEAKAEAWNIADGTALEVTLLTEKPTTGGVHDTTFIAGATKTTVKANITDDIDPELSADTRIVYESGSAKDEAGFFLDIHAMLNEAGTITSNFGDVVDMTKVGAYVVELNATDTAGNKSNTVQTIVLVKDENTRIDEENETMITAHDFVITLTDMPNVSFESLARTLADASAWHIVTGERLHVQLAEELQEHVDIGAHRIVFVVDDNDGKLIAQKEVNVYIYNVVNEDKTYGLNAHDFVISLEAAQNEQMLIARAEAVGSKVSPLPPTTTEYPIVIVGDVPTTIGTHEITFKIAGVEPEAKITVQAHVYNIVNDVAKEAMNAHDFVINLSDINEATFGENFIFFAQAAAYQIDKLAPSPLVVHVRGKMPHSGGDYEVTFESETKATSITVHAVVIDDVAPTLSASPHVVYRKGQMKTEAQFLADVHARLDEPGTITSGFESSGLVDLNTAGVYTVWLQGEDLDGNVSSVVETQVIVRDEYTYIDWEHGVMMRAHSFPIELKDVQQADFIALAEAQAWSIVSGQRLAVELARGLPITVGGDYPVKFMAQSAMKHVYALVGDNRTLKAEERIVYQKGTVKTADEFLADIHARIEGEGTITTNFTSPGVVDLHTIGEYIVKITAHDVNGRPTNVVYTTVVVVDDNTTIDTPNDIWLTAYDFTIHINDVADADFIALARASAFRMSTGEAVDITIVGAKPTDVGVHEVTLVAGFSTRTIYVTITAENVTNEVPNDGQAADDEDMSHVPDKSAVDKRGERIKEKQRKQNGLPVTGEDIRVLLIGLALFVASLSMFIGIMLYRRYRMRDSV